MNTLQLLTKIGLSKSEAQLYLASLTLGPATAIQLGQKLGLSRQMIYTLLPSLQEKGLLKEVVFGKKRLFQAVDPQALEDRALEITKKLHAIVPALQSQAAANVAVPLLAVYDNPVSMREWYRRFMAEAQQGDELLIWATNQEWLGMDPDFLEKFLAFKREKGIVDRVIAPDTPQSRQAAKEMSAIQPSMYRFAADWWQAPAEKWIWHDMVVYLSIHDTATNLVTLESADLAALERFNFEQAWKGIPTTN